MKGLPSIEHAERLLEPGRVELEYMVDTVRRAEPTAVLASRYRPARLRGQLVRQLVRQTLGSAWSGSPVGRDRAEASGGRERRPWWDAPGRTPALDSSLWSAETLALPRLSQETLGEIQPLLRLTQISSNRRKFVLQRLHPDIQRANVRVRVSPGKVARDLDQGTPH